MKRIFCALGALILFSSLPAEASGHGGEAKKPEPGTTVEMPFLIAPMSDDGKLLGYSYITSKLVCASADACIAVREKLAFIQDANVREVNRRPIGLASDPKTADKDQLNARLTANAKRIVGDKKVVSMVFVSISYAPLRPDVSTVGSMPPPDMAPKEEAKAKPAAEEKSGHGGGH